MPYRIYICSYCGQEFRRKSNEVRTATPCCSRSCAAKLRGFGTGPKPRKPANANCAVCGKLLHRPPSHLQRVRTPTCSYQCNGILRGQEWKHHAHKGRAAWTEKSKQSYCEKMSGANNPAWKGGITYRRRKGHYAKSIKYVRCPPEFASMARKDGYIMEHRLVMAQALGRPLLRTETVHHINHDTTDNRPENLCLFSSNSEHKRHEGKTGYFKDYYHHNRTSPHSSPQPTDPNRVNSDS